MPGDPIPGHGRRARSIGGMADLYALDLAFDLLDTTPDDVLAEVRRQLTGDGLLSTRGPAWRVGGMLVGEFAPTDRGGWALTTRQEVHEEQLPEVEDLLLLLAPHVRPPGPVGRLRHYENESPDLLVLRDGRVVQLALDRR
ncbi:hypothetical protein ADK75_20360 [Streptomyces virginiae]|uniref:Uncharacterized protein n=2 Tax=Streptomyces TaxID=1883 RepID=A0A0L8MEK4_STRVG|nr:hypothetical protein ADK75_20360 [Streptomyces virginiae]KOU25563.1 hypothetical protein ADK51_14900 [Streptomyces sp. WM6368]